MQRKVCYRILLVLELRKLWSAQRCNRNKQIASSWYSFNSLNHFWCQSQRLGNLQIFLRYYCPCTAIFIDLLTNLCSICKHTCDTIVFEYGKCFFHMLLFREELYDFYVFTKTETCTFDLSIDSLTLKYIEPQDSLLLIDRIKSNLKYQELSRVALSITNVRWIKFCRCSCSKIENLSKNITIWYTNNLYYKISRALQILTRCKRESLSVSVAK